ncbi:MAG: sigma 54-interacting transcriptional regulator [Proteobacteria bacterium]|nr:sigma 54-interacting transcriptional regulator [Pseudomonadota bacterium]
MPGHSTLQEQPAPVQQTARLLTYVLCYDDLLKPDTTTFALDSVDRRVAIGRCDSGPPRLDTPAQLVICDRWMSRQHAIIDWAAGHYVVRDAGSRNGTWVNGREIGADSEHILNNGDLVEVGHSLLCYRVVPRQAAAALAAERKATPFGPTPTFSPDMAMLLSDLRRVARSTESVLILAETGAGKEIAAAAIHQLSGRSGEYRAVDCGAIPDNLFESTFFGHRRGAFTGANEPRIGEITQADGGTLFLDEIANMSTAAQAKLLRVIETGTLTPLGAAEPRSVDVRWVAATNRELFSDSRFRHDLLRRIAGYVARIPALRQRREDLGVLTAHLLRQAGAGRADMTAPAGRALFLSDLPGNIRQLRAALRSAVLLSGGSSIDVMHLGEFDRSPLDQGNDRADIEPTAAPPPAPPRAGKSDKPSADDVAAALSETGGNVVRAAELLHAHPRQVYRWIKRFSLSLDSFRS